MCGIAGIAFNDTTRQADEPLLRRMTAVMRYRGPDSEGFHVGPGVGLGICQLNLKNAFSGNQPLANEDGTVIVVCDGEIYNCMELRDRLLAKGHRFHSQSDIEVIVHLYEDDPEAFLGQLHGMFALALWDATRRHLVLARDRFGIRPLHYAVTSDGVVFGSELKTVLASGVIPPTLDARGLRNMLADGVTRSPRTMVKDVSRLMAHQFLVFDAGQMTTRHYWDFSFPARDEYDESVGAAEWGEALREQLTQAVRRRQRGDEKVGVNLSPGLDSSALAAILSRESAHPVHTFTLFNDRESDSQTRLLSDDPGFRLIGHRIQHRLQDFNLLPRAVWHGELPLDFGFELSGLTLAANAAEHVEVVLTGDGADSLLGGSDCYWTDKVLAPFGKWPRPLRQMLAHCIARRRPGAARILMAPVEMNLNRHRVLTKGHLSRLPLDLLTGEVGQTDEEPAAWQLPDCFSRWHRAAQLQYIKFNLTFIEAVISTTDLLPAAYSLQMRLPFLDEAVVDLAARIPPRMKTGWLQGKLIFRRAMSDILPAEICRRKKAVFFPPRREWLAGPWPAFAQEAMSEQNLRAKGYFNPKRVAALIAENQAGQADHSALLLTILSTQLWDDLFRKRFS